MMSRSGINKGGAHHLAPPRFKIVGILLAVVGPILGSTKESIMLYELLVSHRRQDSQPVVSHWAVLIAMTSQERHPAFLISRPEDPVLTREKDLFPTTDATN